MSDRRSKPPESQAISHPGPAWAMQTYTTTVHRRLPEHSSVDMNSSSPPSSRAGLTSSSSQTYFDKYPERKGKGPYVPSPKLTPSFRTKADNVARKDAQRVAEEIEEREGDKRRSNRHGAPGADASPLAKYLEKKRDTSGADVKRPSRQTALTVDVCSESPSSSSSSSSLVSSNGEARTGRSGNPLMGGAVVGARVAAASAASRSPSGYPSMGSSITRRASQRNLSQQAIDPLAPAEEAAQMVRKQGHTHAKESDERGQGQISPSPQAVSAFKRRLKTQQSMPDFRPSVSRTPRVSGLSRQPWPATNVEERAAVRTSSTSSRVLSIDEIIKRHSPNVAANKGTSHDTRGGSEHRQVHSRAAPSWRKGRGWGKGSGSEADSDGSDGSLDSIEQEIRQLMRISKHPWESDSKAVAASTLTPSPSTPMLSLSRSTNQQRGARHVQALSIHHTPSPSLAVNAENGTPSFNKPVRSTPSPSGPFTPPPISSPSLKSPTSGASSSTDAEIWHYLRSKRLTRLMTLTRPPHEGLSVSFADVGDEHGHPVFVTLGLGAVRYLVGLYDEMASVLRLRLICIDRWGLGKTDDLSAERRGVLEWSNVVSEVADRLGIQRFSLLAHSAGAPYAMATCLMHGPRIAGPVHLLAPWVSPKIESGYKWLKYVPDGIIKTAQAADWRMQAWKLGLTKTPAHIAGDDWHGSSQDEWDERTDTSWSSAYGGSPHALSTLPLDKKKGIRPPPLLIEVTNGDDSFDDGGALSATTDTLSTSCLGSSPATSSATPTQADSSLASTKSSDSFFWAPDTLSNGNEQDQEAVRPLKSLHRSPSATHLTSADTRHKPLPARPTSQRPQMERSSSSPWNNSAETVSSMPTSTLDLTTALLRASHSESLRGGGTNDLLVILGRSSQKPWGFTYTDVTHPVLVWHGDKDERISMSSILWMEREMRQCKVNLIKGANHSLMTNVGVVIEALER